MSYFFNEAARVEHLEYVAYYESCQPGLGVRYLSALDEAMDKVCQSPDRFRIEFPPNIRKFRVPGFPYSFLPLTGWRFPRYSIRSHCASAF